MSNYIWASLIIFGIIISLFTGKIYSLGNIVLSSTNDAFSTFFKMSLMILFWNGIFNILKDSEGNDITLGKALNIDPHRSGVDSTNKKLFVNLFCVLMAVVMCIGMLHPIVASAGTKEDYRAAQERLDKINKEIAGLKDTKAKQEKEKKNLKR